MSEAVELLARAAFIGIGGAAAMDVWGLVVRRAFGFQGLDYALLGRWIGTSRAVDSIMSGSPPLILSPANALSGGSPTIRSG